MYLLPIALLAFHLVISVKSRAGDLANKKCRLYGKSVYVEEENPLLHIRSGKQMVSRCAISHVPLIVGGIKADEMEFPHMTLIGFGFTSADPIFKWLCGGTLISENFVLTAGHCMSSRDNGPAQRIRVGMINVINPGEYLQEIGIVNRIPHPKYSHKLKYNDIGLLKLSHPVRFTDHVRPACLCTDPNYKWTIALASGYGRLNFDSDETSKDLMKVHLHNVGEKDCQATYKHSRIMPYGLVSSQLCAGDIGGKRDTCQGDSGGPLQVVLESPYCMYNIIGVTSFGKFCGFERSPGIYTRVASYVDWIESIVWK